MSAAITALVAAIYSRASPTAGMRRPRIDVIVLGSGSPGLERFLSFDCLKGRFTVSFDVCHVFVIFRLINTVGKAILELLPKCFRNHPQQRHFNFTSNNLCFLVSQHDRSVSFVSLFVNSGNVNKDRSCNASFFATLFVMALFQYYRSFHTRQCDLPPGIESIISRYP